MFTVKVVDYWLKQNNNTTKEAQAMQIQMKQVLFVYEYMQFLVMEWPMDKRERNNNDVSLFILFYLIYDRVT